MNPSDTATNPTHNPTEPLPMTNATLNETDMAMIPELLQRIANTIVAASSMPREIEALTADVKRLSGEVEAAQATNRSLSDHADRVARELVDVKVQSEERLNHCLRVETDNNDLADKLAQSRRELSETDGKLTDTKRERDDAQFKVLELTEERDALRAKLARFRAVFEEDQPKAPEPTPAPLDGPTSGGETTGSAISETPVPLSDASASPSTSDVGTAEGTTPSVSSEPEKLWEPSDLNGQEWRDWADSPTAVLWDETKRRYYKLAS